MTGGTLQGHDEGDREHVAPPTSRVHCRRIHRTSGVRWCRTGRTCPFVLRWCPTIGASPPVLLEHPLWRDEPHCREEPWDDGERGRPGGPTTTSVPCRTTPSLALLLTQAERSLRRQLDPALAEAGLTFDTGGSSPSCWPGPASGCPPSPTRPCCPRRR